MDQDCSTDISLGLSIGTEISIGLSLGTGTTTRDKDREYASQINVNGPPVQLDLFPIAPFLPPEEKNLRRISIFLPSLTLNYTNRSSPA